MHISTRLVVGAGISNWNDLIKMFTRHNVLNHFEMFTSKSCTYFCWFSNGCSLFPSLCSKEQDTQNTFLSLRDREVKPTCVPVHRKTEQIHYQTVSFAVSPHGAHILNDDFLNSLFCWIKKGLAIQTTFSSNQHVISRIKTPDSNVHTCGFLLTQPSRTCAIGLSSRWKKWTIKTCICG